jgi:hypothetical protein
MSLEQLDAWLRSIEPPAKAAGTSMLDGYLTSIVIGPLSIPVEISPEVPGENSPLRCVMRLN